MGNLILKMAAKMLEEYADELQNNGCNDYFITETDQNISLAKDIIAKSSYPDDEPEIWPNKTIKLKDYVLAKYLKNELIILSEKDENIIK